jgi:hypothetical protein
MRKLSRSIPGPHEEVGGLKRTRAFGQTLPPAGIGTIDRLDEVPERRSAFRCVEESFLRSKSKSLVGSHPNPSEHFPLDFFFMGCRQCAADLVERQVVPPLVWAGWVLALPFHRTIGCSKSGVPPH